LEWVLILTIVHYLLYFGDEHIDEAKDILLKNASPFVLQCFIEQHPNLCNYIEVEDAVIANGTPYEIMSFACSCDTNKFNFSRLRNAAATKEFALSIRDKGWKRSSYAVKNMFN